MSIKKNDRVKLRIDSCSANGSGVGRYEGMAIFVPATAPGDEITAHILKVKKTYAFAKVESVDKPSPDRIEPECPVYLRCGGCAFSHMDYAAEAKIKAEHVAECFRRIGGVEPEFEPIIAAESDKRYRNKAQYPVAMQDGELKIGFFSPHSHRVVNCPDCLLQPTEFADILGVLTDYIKQFNVPVYDETAHKGLLRHIYLRKGEKSGEIMACAVINGRSLPAEDKLVQMLTSRNQNIKSIIINSNTKDTNVILGGECRTLWGSDCITDTLCSLRFRISPLSFYQVNRTQAERLYNKAAEYTSLTGHDRAFHGVKGKEADRRRDSARGDRGRQSERPPERHRECGIHLRRRCRGGSDTKVKGCETRCDSARPAEKGLLARYARDRRSNAARAHSLCLLRPRYPRP